VIKSELVRYATSSVSSSCWGVHPYHHSLRFYSG
jgi:hypothetical protein